MSRPIPFGKYLLLERVGTGGMAEVYKAKVAGTPGLGSPVAIKRILATFASDPEFVRRFVEEARVAQRLEHPNIVPIFELGRVGQSLFLAMEYVYGKDLRAVFERTRQRGEPVPLPLACHVLMKACEGLHHAHETRDAEGRPLGLVHRDVSPQNILASRAGEVKLIDFGIARAANRTGHGNEARMEGKFGYMSPEQVRGLPLDQRSDVFSAGIVLYELLTGERLFVGTTEFSTLEKVRNVDIQPPSEVAPRVPAELSAIVMRALARNPADRYPTAMDLHDALQGFLYSSGTFFGSRDLSTWLRGVFSRDFEAERVREEQIRLVEEEMAEDRDKLGAPDTERHPKVPEKGRPQKPKPPRKQTMVGMGAPPPPPQASQPAGGGLGEWEDDDMATQVYDKGEHGPKVPSEPPPPAPRAAQPVAPPSPARASRPTPTPTPSPAGMPRRESVPPPRPRRNPAGPATAPQAQVPSIEVRDEPPLRGDPTIEDRPGVRGDPDASQGPGAHAPATGAARPRRRRPRERTEVLERPKQGTSRSTLVAVVAMGVLMLAGLGIGAWALLGPKEPATLQLVTDPPDATVLLDDEPVAATSSPFVVRDIAPDTSHLIEVRKEGFRPWSMKVSLKPGETLQLPPVALVPKGADGAVAAAPAPAEGEAADPGEPPAEVGSGRMVVHFHSDPEGAKVEIERGDEHRVIGFAPTWGRMTVEGGPWTVRMSQRGYETWEEQVELPTGKDSTHVRADLTRKEGAPTVRRRVRRPRRTAKPAASKSTASAEKKAEKKSEPEPEPAAKTTEKADDEPSSEATGNGTLRVSTRPWTNVSVDGRKIGSTPQMNISLPPGKHTVRLTNPEFDIDKTLTVQIEAGKTATKILTLSPGD